MKVIELEKMLFKENLVYKTKSPEDAEKKATEILNKDKTKKVVINDEDNTIEIEEDKKDLPICDASQEMNDEIKRHNRQLNKEKHNIVETQRVISFLTIKF